MEAAMTNDKYARRRFDVRNEEALDTEVLETIPFRYPESPTDVVYETEEFTCVCPWTGLPDFGRLRIRYRPGRTLIELKSLKYYLNSFRDVGIIQEHAVNRILDDLVKLVRPRWMEVDAVYRERGGIRGTATARYESES